MTRLENTAEDVNLKNEICIRLQRLEGLFKELEKFDSELSGESSEIMEFEDVYFPLKLKLQNKHDAKIIDPINVETHTQRQNSSVVQSVDSIWNFRLRNLNIPVFSGTFEDWMNVKYLFVTSVHSQTTLSNCQKFQY
ncbi:uncharacterized protein NPIL_98841 [Nephila pilipes]|uniref:Uncharacterized protein n=1 Tax=Nephila pilipes TaxID=299642 RepID=A0A8X6MZ28_NEPPI|nr:uncharacterized protein NPIL_98841 [Nephila pilipes]